MKKDLSSLKEKSKSSGVSEAYLHLQKILWSKIEDDDNSIWRYIRKILDKHLTVQSGIHTTVGGTTTEDITLYGVTESMSVQVTLHTAGASPVTVKSCKCGTDKITVVFSADPSDDHKVNYTVVKS